MIQSKGVVSRQEIEKHLLERFRYQYDEESGTVSVCFHQMED